MSVCASRDSHQFTNSFAAFGFGGPSASTIQQVDPRASIHELHRFLECREGALEMEVVFDPRFDYGRGETRVAIAENGVVAEGSLLL